jgi:hypothetical protein
MSDDNLVYRNAQSSTAAGIGPDFSQHHDSSGIPRNSGVAAS